MVGNKYSIGRPHKVLLCYAVFFVLRIISICNWLIVSGKDQAQIQSHVWSPVCGGENWRKARPVSEAGGGQYWAPHLAIVSLLQALFSPLPWASLQSAPLSYRGLRLWKPQSKSLGLKPHFLLVVHRC